MPQYLVTGCYTAAAFKGMAERCEDRTEASGAALALFNGKIDRYFMVAGTAEFLMLAELPDNDTAAAVASVVIGTGTVTDFKVTPLISMARMPDIFRSANTAMGQYRPPG